MLVFTFIWPFQGGKIRFDITENWTDTIPPPFNGIGLVSVALHELGHSLGLGHTGDPNAVMYAYYTGVHRNLTPDDINGIQALYGGWHDWESLGGTLTSGPAVSTYENDDLYVFIRGSGDAIYEKAFVDDRWYDWKTIGGKSTSGPAAVSQKNFRCCPEEIDFFTDVFARGADNGLLHKRLFYTFK